MKKAILLLSPAIALCACAQNIPVDESPDISSSSSSAMQERPLGVEGAFCGGIAAFQCEPGLVCQYDGTYPDAGGTCVKE